MKVNKNRLIRWIENKQNLKTNQNKTVNKLKEKQKIKSQLTQNKEKKMKF